MDFRGFLNNLPNQDDKVKGNNQKSVGRAQEAKRAGSLRNAGMVNDDKEPPRKVSAVEVDRKSYAASKNYDEQYSYMGYADAASCMSGSFLNDERPPDAASEKELGNEYFKQQKFHEAIECYSRSIALSPSSVAFANRAMAYLKAKRFQEAEDDCTEALNLDDRYVKAYSRRAAARKELGKLKASLEDSEFAMRLEPNNQELQKQYAKTKALYEKEIEKKISETSKTSNGIQKAGNLETRETDFQAVCSTSGSNVQKLTPIPVQTSDMKCHDANHKNELTASMQDLASRAASLVTTTAGKNITAPKSAYQFEVSWRALSDDCTLQAQLLKTTQPSTLPQIFKNALSAPILIDIIKCTASFFREETDLAISIMENLVKVPRFDMIVMCLSTVDRSELHRLWDEVFTSKDIPVDHVEALEKLRSRYCCGEWQTDILGSNGWPKDM